MCRCVSVCGPSPQVLALTAVDVWNTFLVHPFIKEDIVFVDMLPQVLTVARQKLTRVGDPSLNNHPSCLYNKLDFDSLEEYNYFFSSEGHLGSSQVTLGHHRSPWVITGHLGSSQVPWVITGHLGSSHVTLGHHRSPWVITGHLGSSQVTLGHHRSPWVITCHLGSLQVTLGHHRSPWVITGHLGSSQVTLGHHTLTWWSVPPPAGYRSCFHTLVHHIGVLIPSPIANEVLSAVQEAISVPTDSG